MPGRRRLLSMQRMIITLGFLLLAAGTAQASGPVPPCGGAPLPAYAGQQAPPSLGIWTGGELHKDGWQPAPCLGWTGESRLVVALASTFQSSQSLDQLLQRFAAISAYPMVKYWSTTRSQWRPLASESGMLAQPQETAAAPDLAGAALQPGRDFYYFENGDVGGRSTYRLRVVERTPDRAVITSENVSPIRVAIVTAFEPGALQLATYIERAGPDTWRLYQITRVGTASSSLVGNYTSSYANRLEALRRHLAGQPTDGAPPLKTN